MKKYTLTLKLLSVFSAVFVLFSMAANAGESVVGYVLDAQGSVAEQYPVGMPIVNKTKITVSSASKLVVFHNKKCATIEISGAAVTFRLGSYKPQFSPYIKMLSVGCAAEYRPLGQDAGITLRRGHHRTVRNPTLIIRGAKSNYQKIDFIETSNDNPDNKVEFFFEYSSPIIPWPSDTPKLKADTEYKFNLWRNDKRIEFGTTFKTVTSEPNNKSLKLLIIIPD